jgi:hypothetical protein
MRVFAQLIEVLLYLLGFQFLGQLLENRGAQHTEVTPNVKSTDVISGPHVAPNLRRCPTYRGAQL